MRQVLMGCSQPECAAPPARCLSRRGVLVGVAAGLGLLGPASGAGAAVIDGNPLKVFAGQYAGIQARFVGQTDGQFDPPNLDVANAGLTVWINSPGTGSASAFGVLGNPVSPVSGPTLSGSGTELDPYELASQYDVVSGGLGSVHVTQELEYVNGDSGFLARYTLTNPGTDPVYVRPLLTGDLYHAGSDLGFGDYDASPPPVLAGIDDVEGGLGELIGDSPAWSRYQEGGAQHFGFMAFDAFGAGFTNTVDANYVDDVVGVQWDKDRSFGLAGGASDTFQAIWAFSDFDALTLSPGAETKPVGSSDTQTVYVAHGGIPLSGKTVRYAVTGANPTSGALAADANGEAAITWTGMQSGTDTLTAYLDSNGDAVRQDDEPEDVTTVTWPTAATSTTHSEPPPTPIILNMNASTVQHFGHKHQLLLTATCDQLCAITVTGTVTVPAAARVISLKPLTYAALGGARTRVHLKIQHSVASVILKALKKHRRVTASVIAIARNGSASSSATQRSIRIIP
jgi:hypothetical protein